MPYNRAQILADTARKIDEFPRYIRFDEGGKTKVQSIKLLLEPYGLSDNEALVADIERWLEERRQTVLRYYRNQFTEALG